ncbi:phage terminase large subunit [Pantoea brenneri]|uniref:phage terminase large subunit n=1 Tax=Pantoea brenneri TaxID=472694 RepID=UPI00244727C1|nr:phage terminase large subunit [Pantoea brenneri]MDH1085311.1 phage terminase large subunit [Pantoea brenneri]
MLTINQLVDCRTDLLTFTRTMFKARKGMDFVTNWHHEQLCNALERVVIGKCRRLIINIPPRYSKTELAVVNFIAWCMGNFPDSEFIHASYSKRLAANNTWGARALMEHELYASIFGEPDFRKDSNAKDEYRTEQGGCVYAAGSDGTITGYGAGKLRDYFGGAIIIDDPHKAGEATSDVMRQNVIDWFSTTIESRTNSPETPIIVIMQRLHEKDLSGWLLAGGNGEKWEHVCIPVLNDADEPLWAFKHSREELRRMETSSPYVFAGQYMQRPAPLGGGMFKDEWWRYYDIVPITTHRSIYADTAQKVKTHNDWSVFQCWGKSLTGQAVLLDQIRGKWEAPELLIQARAFWEKHKSVSGMGILREMKVEDKVSGTGIIQTLSREGIPVIPIQRNTDKITRAMDAAPLAQSGNVLLPKNAPWLSDYLAEFSQFPNATHDDQVDPTMDALTDLLSPTETDWSKIL